MARFYSLLSYYTYNLSDFDRESSLICGNNMPTRCNRWFLSQILLLAQYISDTIMSIIRSSRLLYRWLLPVVFSALVFKLSVWRGAEVYVSGLRTHNPQLHTICNKNHLLYLVGILFPHIILHALEKNCNRIHYVSKYQFFGQFIS
jgi:hypothetical protein